MRETHDVETGGATHWDGNFGFLLNKLAARMQARFEAGLASFRIRRFQWLILRHLYDAPHRPAQLAAKLGCDRAVITRLLEELQQRGLLTRTIDEEDRRNVVTALSDEGRELTAQLIQVSDEVNQHFLRGLSKADAAVLVSLLRKVLETSSEAEHGPG